MRFENKNSRKSNKNVYDRVKTTDDAKSAPRANVRLQKEEEKVEVKAFEVNPQSPFLTAEIDKKVESDYEKKAKAAYDNVVLNEGIVYNSSAEEKTERINFTLKKDNVKKDESEKLNAQSKDKLDALKQSLDLSEQAIKEEKEEKEKSIEEGIEKLNAQNNEEKQNLAIVSDRTKKKEALYIKFTTARVVGLCLVLFICFGTFFGIGLVVGRDMQGKVTPVALPTIVPSDDKSILVEEDTILKAEELQYSEQLKNTDRDASSLASVNGQADSQASGQTSGQTSGQASTTAQVNALTPYPISDPNTLELAAEKAKAEEAKKIEDATIYDYVIRTATFKAENKASTFNKKLIANNLRGEVVRGANWYFVNVKFRGTPKNFEEMKEKLLKLGIDDSIILSKEALQLG